MSTFVQQTTSPTPINATMSGDVEDKSAAEGKPGSNEHPHSQLASEEDPQNSGHSTAGDNQPPQYYRRLIKRRLMDPIEAAKDPDLIADDVSQSV